MECFMLSRKSTSMLFALGVAALVWPSGANAVTFVQTSDDCSSDKPCGINANNKIEVTADGSNTKISVSFANNWAFVNTGASGSGSSFNFGFSSATTGLIFTAGTPSQWTTTA